MDTRIVRRLLFNTIIAALLAVCSCSHPSGTINPNGKEGSADLAVCNDVSNEYGPLSQDERNATPALVTLADTWSGDYGRQQLLTEEDHPILALEMVPTVAGDENAVQNWCNANVASS